MPTASTYRNAAAELRRTGMLLGERVAALRSIEALGLGAHGAVADLHRGALDDVRQTLLVAGDELVRLAGSCERRALVCDEHARRVAMHRSLPVLERLVTPAPTPPASWVDA